MRGKYGSAKPRIRPRVTGYPATWKFRRYFGVDGKTKMVAIDELTKLPGRREATRTAQRHQTATDTASKRRNGMSTARERTRVAAGVATTAPRRIVEPLFDRQVKYKQLLVFCYHTRYVDIPLIHRCFGDHLPLSTARRYCQVLRDKGYFKAAPTSRTIDAPVHSVTSKAVRYLNQIRGDKRPLVFTRDEVISPNLLPHEIELSNLQVDIYQSAHVHQHVSLAYGDFERRFKLPENRLPYPTAEGTRYYESDLTFLPSFTHNGQQHLLWHLLEHDRGTEDGNEITAKMQALDAWFAAGGGEDLIALYRQRGASDPKPAYRRLIVTQHAQHRDQNDTERLIKVITHLLFLPPQTRHNIFVTTSEQIAASRHDGTLMAKPLWYPMRFTTAWQGPFEALLQESETRRLSKHDRNRRLYEFVRINLPRLRQYALFPPRGQE